MGRGSTRGGAEARPWAASSGCLGVMVVKVMVLIVILGMMVVMVLQREPHIIDTFLISKSIFEVYFKDLKVILTWYFSLCQMAWKVKRFLKEKLLFGFQTNKQKVNELDMKFTPFQCPRC